MDFREMNYVLALARHQNMTKAAESLYVGQPTLSKCLAALEKELGQKLFRRIGNKYVLTYAGELYVKRASGILRMKKDLDEEMADLVRMEKGAVNVSFANMRCSYMLPAVLPVFKRLHPNVKVSVFEGSSDENDRRLLKGEIDVAFYCIPAEPNPMISYSTMAEEELLICTCREHPLKQFAVENPASKYPKLELGMLKDELVLMMRPEQRTRQIVDSILAKEHLAFENVLCTSSIPAILGLAADGYGISFIFEPHLRHWEGRDRIECYSFGHPRTCCDFVASVRKGSYVSQYAKDFIGIVKDCAGI